MESKQPWLSKTMWANIIAITVVILQTTEVLPGMDYVGLEAGLIGMVNILLRLVTKQPITLVNILPEITSTSASAKTGFDEAVKKELDK